MILLNYLDYITREQAISDIIDYIEPIYNQKRRHYKLGFISPIEFEQHLLKTAETCLQFLLTVTQVLVNLSFIECLMDELGTWFKHSYKRNVVARISDGTINQYRMDNTTGEMVRK